MSKSIAYQTTNTCQRDRNLDTKPFMSLTFAKAKVALVQQQYYTVLATQKSLLAYKSMFSSFLSNRVYFAQNTTNEQASKTFSRIQGHSL